jgi:hypothetical protein
LEVDLKLPLTFDQTAVMRSALFINFKNKENDTSIQM